MAGDPGLHWITTQGTDGDLHGLGGGGRELRKHPTGIRFGYTAPIMTVPRRSAPPVSHPATHSSIPLMRHPVNPVTSKGLEYGLPMVRSGPSVAFRSRGHRGHRPVPPVCHLLQGHLAPSSWAGQVQEASRPQVGRTGLAECGHLDLLNGPARSWRRLTEKAPPPIKDVWRALGRSVRRSRLDN
jgi:hypothetical protein